MKIDKSIKKLSKSWCMCTKLESVARDGYSTCSICNGIDAYGGSKDRPEKYFKKLEENKMSVLEKLENGIKKREEESRDFYRKMAKREELEIKARGGKPIPGDVPSYYGFRQASYRDYGDWLIGYLLLGGSVSHHYDYNMPDNFYVATQNFELPSFCGSQSVSVLIPLNINTGQRLGHNSYYFMREFKHGSSIVPIYSDVKEYITPRIKKLEKKRSKGNLSIVEVEGGELSKVEFDGRELSVEK